MTSLLLLFLHFILTQKIKKENRKRNIVSYDKKNAKISFSLYTSGKDWKINLIYFYHNLNKNDNFIYGYNLDEFILKEVTRQNKYNTLLFSTRRKDFESCSSYLMAATGDTGNT